MIYKEKKKYVQKHTVEIKENRKMKTKSRNKKAKKRKRVKEAQQEIKGINIKIIA